MRYHVARIGCVSSDAVLLNHGDHCQMLGCFGHQTFWDGFKESLNKIIEKITVDCEVQCYLHKSESHKVIGAGRTRGWIATHLPCPYPLKYIIHFQKTVHWPWGAILMLWSLTLLVTLSSAWASVFPLFSFSKTFGWVSSSWTVFSYLFSIKL